MVLDARERERRGRELMKRAGISSPPFNKGVVEEVLRAIADVMDQAGWYPDDLWQRDYLEWTGEHWVFGGVAGGALGWRRSGELGGEPLDEINAPTVGGA